MRVPRTARHKAASLILWLGMLGLLLPACSHQSVRHLDRQPWSLNSTRSLEMNCRKFNYRCARNADGLRVSGTAFPLREAIPEWAMWTQDIWLGAYLSDREGQVLAKQIDILSPQPYDPESGYSFDFLLQPQNMAGPGQIFITFGYRLVLSDRRPDQQAASSGDAAQPRLFFANELALNRL